MSNRPVIAILAFLTGACASSRSVAVVSGGAWPDRLAADMRVALVSGFSGPEAVRYDADQDVYFVGNFNGDGGELDGNGFISRVSPDGAIQNLRFIEGGRGGVTLHAPRGMAIVGDTLWACDVDAVRGFHRRTGAPLATVDFSGRDVGFLNDISPGPDGALYVTDTGRNRIYRIMGGRIAGVTEDTRFGMPNGITWDAAERVFIVVPWGGGTDLAAFDPTTGAIRTYATGTGGRYDGVEVLPNRSVVVASQADTSLHVFRAGSGRPFVRTAGRPADIAVDTRRMRVAVPFISLNSVEIWQLPR